MKHGKNSQNPNTQERDGTQTSNPKGMRQIYSTFTTPHPFSLFFFTNGRLEKKVLVLENAGKNGCILHVFVKEHCSQKIVSLLKKLSLLNSDFPTTLTFLKPQILEVSIKIAVGKFLKSLEHLKG